MKRSVVADGLVVDCVQLRAGSVDALAVRCDASVVDPALVTARVIDGAVSVDAMVRPAGDAVLVEGRVEGAWAAECRRCLREVKGLFDIRLKEVFEDDPTDGETWPIAFARIDLEPPVREAALLALPLAPLCSTDCAGPVPDRFPTGMADRAEVAGNAQAAPAGGSSARPAVDGSPAGGPAACESPIDPRWAALSDIHFSE